MTNYYQSQLHLYSPMVTKYTRAGKNGKTIECPYCLAPAHVFHFSWSALTCQYCGKSINKLDWRLQ